MDDHSNDTLGFERKDTYNEADLKALEESFEGIIKHVGEDVSREGLLKTINYYQSNYINYL